MTTLRCSSALAQHDILYLSLVVCERPRATDFADAASLYRRTRPVTASEAELDVVDHASGEIIDRTEKVRISEVRDRHENDRMQVIQKLRDHYRNWCK